MLVCTFLGISALENYQVTKNFYVYFLKSIEFSTKLPNFVNKKIQGFDPLLINRGTKSFQVTGFLKPCVQVPKTTRLS